MWKHFRLYYQGPPSFKNKRLVKATAINSVMENEVLWGLIEGTQDRDQRRFHQKMILKG